MTVVASPSDLDVLAADIREWWGQSRTHQIDAWQGYLTVGALLMQARATFVGDREYGRWFDEQEFGFSSEWARRLVKLAENRTAVLDVLQSALASKTGKPPGVDALLTLVNPPAPQPVGVDVDRPDPVYQPDHLRSVIVEIIVTYPFGTTKREEGAGHGSGAEHKEWHAQIVMQHEIPDSLISLDGFTEELARRFRQAVWERNFQTMKR